MLRAPAACLLALFAGAVACRPPKPTETHTFFQNEEDFDRNPVETPYPPLDLAAADGANAYVGVAVLGGVLRFSRPAKWRVRRGSTAPDHRYVEYVSPNEYLVAIYQRSEDPGTSWGDVGKEYEDDAKKHRVEFEGKDVPIAGYETQGREYVLRRKVKGQRTPYVNTSREFLFRGKHAYALVEVVHQGRSDASIERELLRVVETLSVL